jgi:hypothetical protein
MKFMYALRQEENAVTINRLYTFYSVLNILFRKTICPRDGDPTNISQFAKNLLANMRDGAPPLSMMDFYVGSDKGHLYEPLKDLWLCTLSYVMIEDVTSRSFPKEGKHMTFRPKPTNKPLIPPA